MYWIIGVIGLGLALSPFIFNYATHTAALWVSLITGFGAVLVSIIEATRGDKERWEYWVAGGLGLVALVAPFVFNFTGLAAALWISIIAGGLITLLAGSRLFVGKPKYG